MLVGISNHLWQSTLFTAASWQTYSGRSVLSSNPYVLPFHQRRSLNRLAASHGVSEDSAL